MKIAKTPIPNAVWKIIRGKPKIVYQQKIEIHELRCTVLRKNKGPPEIRPTGRGQVRSVEAGESEPVGTCSVLQVHSSDPGPGLWKKIMRRSTEKKDKREVWARLLRRWKSSVPRSLSGRLDCPSETHQRSSYCHLDVSRRKMKPLTWNETKFPTPWFSHFVDTIVRLSR